jgi:tRNA threonylcarbamoyladenosine biosynthesis protein TsaB
MKLLAIDTSASACSVGLMLNEEIFSLHRVAPMQQTQLILPMLAEILQANNLELNQLDALVYGCGPGSFTGVRIAASVIQGLAFASQLPIIKISSLAATAQAAYNDLGWQKILVGMDARINEVYWSAYQVGGSGLVELVGQEAVCPPQGITVPETTDWCGVGSAWQVYLDTLLATLVFEPLGIDAARLPMAAGLLRLAKEKYLRKDFVGLHEALPVYLRDDVAKKR